MAYSLTYSYDSSIQSYSVTGYSNITTSDKVVIQSTYDDGTNGSHPVTRIGYAAFSGCSGLTSITIPDSVTFIGRSAFSGCSGLISVTIGNSVTSIDNGAFVSCSKLTSVTIPDSVTSIGVSAFNNCSGLTSVTIGNSVTSIGSHTFFGCKGLTRVTIPDSVTSIGGSAFYDCTNLTQLILFPSTPPTLGSSAIPSTISKIYVPQSSKEAYKTATNWASFANKIVSDNLYLSFIRFNRKNKEYIDKKIQDNDIASLNVVDGTAADNQVELQITKQDAGTIDGPAIVGKDGITINKAADSEKIEISGSGLVQKDTTPGRVVYGHNSDLSKQMFYISENNGNPNWLVKYSGDDKAGATEPQGTGRICSKEPTQPYQLANKKYVDDAVAGSSAALEAELNKKQATLVSGTNIKTINGNSLLGSGDLTITGGGTEVTPNPTLSGSEAALSALQIGDTKYRIEGSLTTLMVGIDSSLLGG